MICPKCGSHNVQVTNEQVYAKTSSKGNGCLWSMGRAFLILMTCGLWLLIGKHKGTSKTRFKNNTVGICQDCGYRFDVE